MSQANIKLAILHFASGPSWGSSLIRWVPPLCQTLTRSWAWWNENSKCHNFHDLTVLWTDRHSSYNHNEFCFQSEIKIRGKVTCHERVCKGVMGEHSSWVLHISVCFVTAFALDYLFNDICIENTFGDRKSISLCGRGQSCCLPTIIKNVPFWAKTGQAC